MPVVINPPTIQHIIRVNTSEVDTNITWTEPPTSTGWPSYDFGGGIKSVVAGNNISVDNTDIKNPIVSVPENLVNSVVAGTNISVNNADIKNPVVSFSGSLGPVISSAVAIYGDVRGGDIVVTGLNQITIQPISCLDSTGSVQLHTEVNTPLSIPSEINQIYHIFVVRLVANGSISFKAYTTEAAAASDPLINAYRWIDYWFTNSSRNCRDGITVDGVHWWKRVSENYINSVQYPPYYPLQSIDISSFLPYKRFTSILFGCVGEINGQVIISPTSDAIFSSLGSGSGIVGGFEWYNPSTAPDFIPITDPILWWGGGADISGGSWTGQARLAIHAVKLKR